MPLLRPRMPSEYPTTLLWFFDQTHVTVTAITASVVLLTRDPHVVWFAVGALGSSLTAKASKTLIRQSRPPPPSDTSLPSPVRPKKTYGMPSTHSTALSFYFFYLLPIIYRLPSILGTTATSPSPLANSPATTHHLSFSLPTLSSQRLNVHLDLLSILHSTPFAITVLTYWAGGLWSRVKLGYHTYPQVLGGALLGSILAVGWRAVWEESEVVRRLVGSAVRLGLELVLSVVGGGTGWSIGGREL